MFAPAPMTVGRAYPGTSRRQRTNENAGVHLPSKTPVKLPLGGGGGGLLKPGAGPSTAGRALLGAKTMDRNVLAPKEAPIGDIGPKRLFQSTCKPSGSSSSSQPPAASSLSNRTLKTPGPSQPQRALRTPGPQRMPVGSPLPLPSAQRTRRRSRASLQSSHGTPDRAGRERSASLSFQTPAPRWEEEVSLDSIVEADVEEAEPAPVEAEFELEYAAPTAVDMPYVPAWADDVPDPIETMKALCSMRPTFYIAPPTPPPEVEHAEYFAVPLCDDDELEHPLFRKQKQQAKAAAVAKAGGVKSAAASTTAKRAPLASRTTTAPAARPAARPATAVPARTGGPATTVASRTSAAGGSAVRPATSLSTRAPPRPLSVAARAGAIARPASTTALRSSSKAGATTARPASASAPIRGVPRPAPAGLDMPALPADLDDFTLDLDLDVLGPDPSLTPMAVQPALPPRITPPETPSVTAADTADTTDEDIAKCISSLSLYSPAVLDASPLPTVDPSAEWGEESIPLQPFRRA